MRNWLIYEPPGGAHKTLEDAEKLVSVREGFSKTAFFFAPFWLVAKRCWLALVVWLVAMVVVVALIGFANVRGAGAFILFILPNVAVGLENAWIRARALERRGFKLSGSVMARSREEAEVLFFQDWLAARPAETASAPGSSAHPYRPAAATGGRVLGLFPQPGGAR